MTTFPIRMLLILLVVALSAWTVIARQDVDAARGERDSARSELDRALSERDAVIRVANETAERLAKAAANDLKHTQELSHALKANQDLHLAVDDGRRRLLIKATCPTSTVRSDAGAGGMADGSTAELAADARSDYFTLRDQLARSKQMILGLQDHVRSFCTTQPSTTGTAP